MTEKNTFWKALLGVIREHLEIQRNTRRVKGDIDVDRILAHLRASERALSTRIDALELYVDDVTEKYLKKGERKERYAREKDQELVVEPINGFEMIRQKYGGHE